MIDIKIIRENPEIVRQNLVNRNLNPNLVDDFLVLDEEWRGVVFKIDNLRAAQKKLTQNIDEARIQLLCNF